MRFLKERKGLTTLEVLILTPFIMYLILAAIIITEREVAKVVTAKAAREAHRVLAVSHNIDMARDIAIENVATYLPTEWSLPDSSLPRKVFDPDNPNSPKDALPDVFIEDDGLSCLVRVRYHVVVPAPVIARLMNPDAELLDKYLTVESVVTGHREFDIPED